MTDQDFTELADIILTLKNKTSIVKELEALYRDGTDDGYDNGYEQGKRHGYEMCIEERDL